MGGQFLGYFWVFGQLLNYVSVWGLIFLFTNSLGFVFLASKIECTCIFCKKNKLSKKHCPTYIGILYAGCPIYGQSICRLSHIWDKFQSQFPLYICYIQLCFRFYLDVLRFFFWKKFVIKF